MHLINSYLLYNFLEGEGLLDSVKYSSSRELCRGMYAFNQFV